MATSDGSDKKPTWGARLRAFSEPRRSPTSPKTEQRKNERRRVTAHEPKWVSFTKLAVCFAVIQANASLFVLLRDRVTQHFKFPSPLFLVFASKLASVVLAAAICLVRRREFSRLHHQQQAASNDDARWWRQLRAPPRIRRMPLVEFALMALSDSVGRSLQIESRRAQQVGPQGRLVAQAAKALAVMAMGHFVLGTARYSRRDFAQAALASVGLATFLLSVRVEPLDGGGAGGAAASAAAAGEPATAAAAAAATTTTGAGLAMLVLYTACDAFTWQWQARLYKRWQVDQYTVMLWLNACQLAVVGGSLAVSGEGRRAVAFLLQGVPTGGPGQDGGGGGGGGGLACARLVCALAALAASSQLTVLYAARRFGPVALASLLSARKAVAMGASAAACGLGLRSAAGAGNCAGLWRLLLWHPSGYGPVPLLSALATLALLAGRAYRAPPLPAELRTAPTQITVS